MLYRLISESACQCNRQEELKEGIKKACRDNAAAADITKGVNGNPPGIPHIEVEQTFSLSTITKIVQSSTVADDNRRTGCLHSVKNLDDLYNKLMYMGFKLSGSRLYLHLLFIYYFYEFIFS